MGYVKTGILMAAMTGLFLAMGYVLAGAAGALIAFAVAAGMNALTWWKSDTMVLRLHNAREVDAHTAPELQQIIMDLAQNAQMPTPKIYVIDNPQPNAFATGRNPDNAAVAATTGLLERLSHEEIAAVMAHELAHIRNYDTLTMTVTATFAGAISMLANFALFFRGGRNRQNAVVMIALMFLAPLAAGIVQMAVSRSREYEADRVGAQICGNPLWLASALQRIQGFASQIDNATAERNPATAHMFIINPLHAFARNRLFSTHPSTEDRVRALQNMAQQMGVTYRRPAAPRAARPSGPWS